MILTWEETFRAGAARCGGKGYNLARLHRYGFSVPRGGVLPADVYERFIRDFPVDRFANLDADRALDAARDLEALRAQIEGSKLPADVRSFLPDTTIAIRSSAVSEDGSGSSFAGIHRSILDVRDADARERAVLACFASLWTPRAVAYRRARGIPDRDVACAVVLCEMVPAVSAGVAFSCDPRTGRRDLVVIDAARGAGEQVVSGAVTPDHVEIRLSWGKAEVVSRQAGTPPALTPPQEVELAGLVERIHWALGDGQDPQDVEWVHDGRRFWILQSRPVTKIPRFTFDGAKGMPVHWSTANIKDAVPGVVSMLAWSLITDAIDGILHAAPRLAGYRIPEGLQIVKRVDGRAYFDLTSILWCFYDALGAHPERSAKSIGGHQPLIPVPPGDPLDGPDGKDRRRRVRRVARRMLFFPSALKRAIRAQFKEVRDLLDHPSTTAPAIIDAMERIARLYVGFNPIVGLANSYGPAFQDEATRLLEASVGRDEAARFITRLASGSGGMASAEQGYRIDDIAEAARNDPAALAWLKSPNGPWTALPPDSRFRREFAKFLEDFGHRAVYEADVLNPRWGDDPTYILDQVRRHLDHPPIDRAAGRSRRDEAWAEVKAKVPFFKRLLLRFFLGRMRWGYAARENAKSAMAATVWPTRRMALECGRLLKLSRPELAFNLCRADLVAFLRGQWDGAGAEALAGDREVRREEQLKRPDPPDVVTEGAPPPPPAAAPAPGATRWSGIPASAGRATGVARLIRHPDAGRTVERGEILVAPSTDPGWTPLFLRTAGVVMETGGFLSHGAIVAREFGIPAVVNVPGIMAALRDGQRVTVDGDQGIVST